MSFMFFLNFLQMTKQNRVFFHQKSIFFLKLIHTFSLIMGNRLNNFTNILIFPLNYDLQLIVFLQNLFTNSNSIRQLSF